MHFIALSDKWCARLLVNTTEKLKVESDDNMEVAVILSNFVEIGHMNVKPWSRKPLTSVVDIRFFGNGKSDS